MANSDTYHAAPDAIRAALEGKLTCDSPSLRLFKFATITTGGNQKKTELDDVVACAQRAQEKLPPSEELPWELPTPKGAEEHFYKLRSRLAINLAEGILENAGICLHPHFGVPMIPGSAVKGITRHAAWQLWQEGKVDVEQFSRIFGSAPDKPDKPESAGTIAFLPALPERSGGHLEVDVLTCHHRKYYQSNDPAAPAHDIEDPNPQFFLTAKAGTTFRVLLAPRPMAHPDDLKTATEWLHRALTENGAGAKTAAGYGWFNNVTESIRTQRAQDEAKKLKRRREETIARDFKALEAIPDKQFSIEQEQRVIELEKMLTECSKAFQEPYQRRLEDLKQRCPSTPKSDYDVDFLNHLRKSDEKTYKRALCSYNADKDPPRAKSIIRFLKEQPRIYKDVKNSAISGLSYSVRLAIMNDYKAADTGGTK